MKDRKYAYLKRIGNDTFCIMFSLGAYYVSRLAKSERGTIAYTMRKYKTLSGAERYLLHNLTGDIKEILYETEAYIKKGEYWK